MTFISAIELENFQAIEIRTRFELKPITVLYGQRGGAQAAIFDAIDLLRALLDPSAVDETAAAGMAARWARTRKGNLRETFLAVEFTYESPHHQQPLQDVSQPISSETQSHCEARTANTGNHSESGEGLDGQTVRIELNIGVNGQSAKASCELIEGSCQIGIHRVLKLTLNPITTRKAPQHIEGAVSAKISAQEEAMGPDRNRLSRWPVPKGERRLEVSCSADLLDSCCIKLLGRSGGKDIDDLPSSDYEGEYSSNYCLVGVSISPLRLKAQNPGETSHDGTLVKIAEGVLNHLGAMLWDHLGDRAPVVKADRQPPSNGALAVVDLMQRPFPSLLAPMSAAAQLICSGQGIDVHFRRLAEAAYADMVQRSANSGCWYGGHIERYVEPVRARAEVFQRVNHHLGQSLFSIKLYRLECECTPLANVGMEKSTGWSFHTLAQPVVVRLYLTDAAGIKLDLEDITDGMPSLLPVLYSLSRQGLVRIEYPELGLHPALQACTADVLIEELHRPRFGQILIQTQSEHFLLRLLRRVRETQSGKVLSQDARLTTRDLVVTYL